MPVPVPVPVLVESRSPSLLSDGRSSDCLSMTESLDERFNEGLHVDFIYCVVVYLCLSSMKLIDQFDELLLQRFAHLVLILYEA